MAKKPTEENKEGAAAAEGNGAAPSLNVLAQYIKDLSFENPKEEVLVAKQIRYTHYFVFWREIGHGSGAYLSHRYAADLEQLQDFALGSQLPIRKYLYGEFSCRAPGYFFRKDFHPPVHRMGGRQSMCQIDHLAFVELLTSTPRYQGAQQKAKDQPTHVLPV